MRMPGQGTGLDTLVNEYGIFHLSRMLADSKTKDLATGFQVRQDALEAKGKAFIAASRSCAAAEASLARTDLDMDNLVRELYFAKIAACGNNKKDAVLKRWFPDGLSAIVRGGSPEELGKVRVLVLVLGETPDDPLAAQYLPRLKAMADTYAKAIDAHSASVSAASGAWELAEAEKVNWLSAYQRDYGDILSAFAGNKRTADSFFKAAAKAKKGVEAPVQAPAAK